MFYWLFNNEDIYPLNAPITQVLVNTVVKGDFFLYFTWNANHLQPRETLQKPSTSTFAFSQDLLLCRSGCLNCILLCL